MKNTKRFGMFLAAILLAAAIIAPLPALAAHGDFSITYTAEPSLVGYKGADVRLSVRVTNEGASNITGFRVGVTTIAGFSSDHTGTITPGNSRTVTVSVPFERDDLNTDKLLTVAIENDGSAPGSTDYMRDGTQVRTFQIEAVYNIFEKTKDIAPLHTAYRVGDTVNVTYTFRNNFASHAATGMTTEAHMFVDSAHTFWTAADNHGAFMPGEVVETAFTYTFLPRDIGRLEIIYHAEYTLMGKHYVDSGGTIEFDVLPARTFGFEPALSASPSTIDAGDEVTFTTRVTNSGETRIMGGQLLNAEGGVMVYLTPIAVGETRAITTTAHIFETTNVSYVVYCEDGEGNSDHEETNAVRITVRAPETETAPPVPTITALLPTEIPAPSIAPAGVETPLPQADVPGEDVLPPEDLPPEDSKITLAAQGEDNTVLYIIIGVLAALITAGAVAIPLILRKRKIK